MGLQFNTRDPIYMQVIQYFKEKMATNIFEPGEEIPSRRELAQSLKINPNTVQRAYKEMERTGLIFTEGNNPSQITKDEAVLKHVREELIDQAVDNFISAIDSIQVPFEQAEQRLQERYQARFVKKGVENND